MFNTLLLTVFLTSTPRADTVVLQHLQADTVTARRNDFKTRLKATSPIPIKEILWSANYQNSKNKDSVIVICSVDGIDVAVMFMYANNEWKVLDDEFR